MPLLNYQYDELMRGYAQRQAENRRELAERLERIYAELPELPGLQDSITACQAQRVRAALSGESATVQELEQRLAQLTEQRSALLSSRGYTAADLDLSYSCPDCQDTGYIGAQKCHCFRQAEIDLLYHQSHLSEVLQHENFNTFSYAWYQEGEEREQVRRAVMEARLFIENFDSSFQNLLLLGAVGTGKTFLSNCIAAELLNTCHSVVYLTAFQLFDLLEKAAFGRTKDTEDIQTGYPYLFDCDLLIIDDLGTELANSFTVSQFFLCINERILRRRSTIISSNLNMEMLRNTYSERTLSRIISCYNIWQMPGSDIRLKKKLQGSAL